MSCDHPQFLADINVGRITQEEGGPVVAFIADASVECAVCGQQFEVCWDEPADPTIIPLSIELQQRRPWVSGLGRIMGWCLRPVSEREPWQGGNVDYSGSA